MLSKTKNLVAFVLFFLLLVIVRLFWQHLDFLPWNATIDHFATSFIAVSLALILVQLIGPHLRDKRVRSLFHNLIFLGVVVVIFFIFQDQLLAIGISLGIIAAVLTILFQAPLLSLMGWIYLSIARVYSEGDRIRIGGIKGDVVDINPLRTKVLEVGGEYVYADLASGRVFTFPNSLLLSEPVSNYTKGFPYIWVDIPFQLSYQADFSFVMKETGKILKKHLKADITMVEERYEKFVRSFGIKDTEFVPVQYNLIPTQAGWIEFRVTFPVDPHQQSAVTTAVTQDILAVCNASPQKSGFPKGRSR